LYSVLCTTLDCLYSSHIQRYKMAFLQLLGRTWAFRRTPLVLNNNINAAYNSKMIFDNSLENNSRNFSNDANEINILHPWKNNNFIRIQRFSKSSNDAITVQHSKETSIFTIEIADNPPAYLKYRQIDRSSIDLYTTVVPASLEGQGIAKILANAAFAFARENKLKIKPSCWYIDGYLKRHPQADLEILKLG